MTGSAFFIRSSTNTQLGGSFPSLEAARAYNMHTACTPAYIEEYVDSNHNSRPIYHSYWPRPQPLPPAHIPDLTESVAYSICARSVESAIYSSRLDISELMESYSSQPHEDVLQDHCRDVASEIYGANKYHFHGVVPADPGRAKEMERAIVDELCSLVETVLARRLRELASMYQRAAESLEQN